MSDSKSRQKKKKKKKNVLISLVFLGFVVTLFSSNEARGPSYLGFWEFQPTDLDFVRHAVPDQAT